MQNLWGGEKIVLFKVYLLYKYYVNPISRNCKVNCFSKMLVSFMKYYYFVRTYFSFNDCHESDRKVSLSHLVSHI